MKSCDEVVLCNGQTVRCVRALHIRSLSHWHSGPVCLNPLLQVHVLHRHWKPLESVEGVQYLHRIVMVHSASREIVSKKRKRPSDSELEERKRAVEGTCK